MKSRIIIILSILIFFFSLGTFFLISESNFSQIVKSKIPKELKSFLKVSLFYLPNVIDQNRRLKQEKDILYKKISKLETTKNLANEKFFPSTQFLDLRYSEIQLDLKTNISYDKYGEYVKPFYIDAYKQDLIIVNKEGKFFYQNISDILKNKLKFNKIKTDIPSGEITDILVYNDFLYVALVKKDKNNCLYDSISLYKSEVKLNFFNFTPVYENTKNMKLTKDCNNKSSPTGGVIEIDTKNNSILFSGYFNDENFKRSDVNSKDKILKTDKFAKIFSINLENGKKKIISEGHRNPLGLIKNKKGYILSTEHGPRGGDEINKIQEGKNYGWPNVSAGEPYSTNPNDIYFYKKNHEEYGYEEPIYSFVPSIGISRIIEINNNFSKKWKNNYFISSLKKRSLYRVEFDKEFTKVKTIEKIYIGKRIRDIIYFNDKKIFFLALESKESYLGIIYK